VRVHFRVRARARALSLSLTHTHTHTHTLARTWVGFVCSLLAHLHNMRQAVLQHYPYADRPGMPGRLPLWLRLENTQVDNRLNLEDWMYTAEKTRFKPRPDCPPLQLPYLGLPPPHSDAHLRRPPEWSRVAGSPGSPARRKLPSAKEAEAEAEAKVHVAQALLALVHDAPEGLITGAQLCSRLYRQCPEARAIVHAHQGLKGFIECSELEGKVCFIADQVCVCAIAFERCGPLGSSGEFGGRRVVDLWSQDLLLTHTARERAGWRQGCGNPRIARQDRRASQHHRQQIAKERAALEARH